MTFVPFPNGAKAVFDFHNSLNSWHNILWFMKFEYSNEDLQALADALDQYVGGVLLADLAVLNYYDGVHVYDMQTIDGAVVNANAEAGQGVDSGDTVPVSAAVVTTYRTGFRGRSARGRTYWAGFSEDNWTGTAWAAGLLEDIEDMLGGMKSAIQALGWTWVVASKQEDGELRSTVLGRPVTEYVHRSGRNGSQRRRTGRS